MSLDVRQALAELRQVVDYKRCAALAAAVNWYRVADLFTAVGRQDRALLVKAFATATAVL